MTVYEFLTLPTKEKGKYCRKQGIVKHRTFPKTYEELCEALNLVDDKTVIVDYYNTSDSGKYVVLYLGLLLDCGFEKPVKIEFNYLLEYNCTFKFNWFYDIQYYSKVCDLYDDRDNHNNLACTVHRKDSIISDFITAIDNGEDYISMIRTYLEEYAPYVKKVEELCFNGEFEKSYDKYSFIKFKRGAGILANDGAPYFNGLVDAFYNLNEKFEIDASLDDLMALSIYACVHKEQSREYYEAIKTNPDAPKNEIIHIFNLFYKSDALDKELTREYVLQLIETAKIDRDVNNDDKKSWQLTLRDMRKDFYYAIKEIQPKIAEKYGIDIEYLPFSCNYSPERHDAITWLADVPEKYRDKYR